MTTTTEVPMLYRANQARKLLGGIGSRKFYELLNSGRLKAVKLDGNTCIHSDELQRFMAELPNYRATSES
jgi:excisionase family DNA binding protein